MVAASDAKILGVIITHQEWVDDLWVLQEYRRQGVGRRLLAQGESEIAALGCQTCRLRVVKSNLVAVQEEHIIFVHLDGRAWPPEGVAVYSRTFIPGRLEVAVLAVLSFSPTAATTNPAKP
jgi:GNAT superfamily N-acetyltransferase